MWFVGMNEGISGLGKALCAVVSHMVILYFSFCGEQFRMILVILGFLLVGTCNQHIERSGGVFDREPIGDCNHYH